MDTYDVAVIGGGPAGAMAAYELAKRHVRVVLFEKEKLPRYKACGGVVAPHVEKILDFSIAPTIERRITKMRITVNFKHPFTTESPRPFAYMVMRDTFDQYLVEVAAHAGATIRQASPLTKLKQTPEGYLLQTRTGETAVSYLIGADGANSMTRKLVGAPHFQRLTAAVERELHSSPDQLNPWNETMALDFGHLSSGYAWIFPKANNFSVGVGGPKAIAKQFVPYYNETIAYYKNALGNTEPYISAGHCLPIRVRHESIIYGHTLFVGDAAGLIDPLAGEGIYYAIRSGQMAAETVARALISSDKVLTEYEKRVDQEIQPELQASKALLVLLDLAPGFWVPRLMKPASPFWQYFCRIFTGESDYQDFPRTFGPLGKLLYLLPRD